MKKLITTIIASFFIGSIAFADTSVGVRLSAASMDATGSHTTNSASGGSGGAAVNVSDSADFTLASIFVEKSTTVGNMDISFGLDVIPMSAEVDTLGGGDGFDATVEVSKVMTAYIQPTFNAGAVSFFLKAGYTQGDLDINSITRQDTNAGTASTDGEQSKSLEGTMYGIGLQRDVNNGFIRLEGTFTDFDEISHTNSNSKIVKADAEMTLISLSYGKSF